MHPAFKHWLELVFKDDLRDGLLRSVGKRQGRVFDAQPGGELSGFAVKRNARTSARQAHHFAIAPAHAVVPTRAQSFHRRLLGREAGGVTLRTIRLRIAILDFSYREDAPQKTIAEALDRLPNARNLRNINACADDHSFLVYTLRLPQTILEAARSEERRVGKECRSRWSP